MKCKTHLPPIYPLCDYYSNNPGSLDLTALNNQLPNKMSQSIAYDEITNLSRIIESLQKENQMLIQKLNESINNNHNNKNSPALILEQKLEKFTEHLQERDKELVEISKCLSLQTNFINLQNQKRKQSKKTPIFDLFTSSLLISNDQKKFFKAPELERQNNELREMIDRQNEKIQLVKARQSIYSQLQQRNSISTKFDQLQEFTDSSFEMIVPDQSAEQDLTIQMLQLELKSLIKTRKQLTEQQKIEKYNLRLYRLQYRSALIIQCTFRGFIARKLYKRQKNAAILIEKITRGYLVRHKLKSKQKNDKK